jgi:hypothetical protein
MTVHFAGGVGVRVMSLALSYYEDGHAHVSFRIRADYVMCDEDGRAPRGDDLRGLSIEGTRIDVVDEPGKSLHVRAEADNAGDVTAWADDVVCAVCCAASRRLSRDFTGKRSRDGAPHGG